MPKLAPPPTTEMAANIPDTVARSHDAGHTAAVSATADSEDFTDFQPVSDSADPACQSYFSAYGLGVTVP